MSKAGADFFTAIVPAPFGGIGIRIDDSELRELVYLPPEYQAKPAPDALTKKNLQASGCLPERPGLCI